MDNGHNMNKENLEKYIITPALEYLEMHSEAAVNLLLGTCAQESEMGRYVRQISGGPGVGIYQIEPRTHEDVIVSYALYRNALIRKLKMWSFGQTMTQHLSSSVFYQTLIARIIYYRAPEALPEPNDIEGLANYWKKYYNTVKGKGRVEDFVSNYRRYARDT